MTVLGDVLDAILKPLDYGRRPVPIENADNNERMLYRPWTDILTVNKREWTAKHDAGNILNLDQHKNSVMSILMLPSTKSHI